MAVYRYQVVSVGMWRGQIKRWNTTFHRTVNNATSYFYDKMTAAGYKAPGDVLGACSGGVSSIAVYNVLGGAPLSRTIYFDWKTPSTWIPYTGTAWASIDPTTPLDAAGESAVVVEGNMASLSSSGKPVKTRKYLHAVPSRTGPTYSDPDVPTAVATALEGIFTPAAMANPIGVAPATVSVDAWYGNHQRVRGRRRTSRQVAAQSFSAGVVAGSGAPFPEPRIEFLNQ